MELIRPCHAQYGQMKTELELLRTLSEAQEEVDAGKVGKIQDTFEELKKVLIARSD